MELEHKVHLGQKKTLKNIGTLENIENVENIENMGNIGKHNEHVEQTNMWICRFHGTNSGFYGSGEILIVSRGLKYFSC